MPKHGLHVFHRVYDVFGFVAKQVDQLGEGLSLERHVLVGQRNRDLAKQDQVKRLGELVFGLQLGVILDLVLGEQGSGLHRRLRQRTWAMWNKEWVLGVWWEGTNRTAPMEQGNSKILCCQDQIHAFGEEGEGCDEETVRL